MLTDELIFRSDALKALSNGEGCGNICSRAIRRIPAVDAVPVVRCRDCKYYNITCCSPGFGWCERSGHNHGTTDDWFCADGVMEDD